MLADRERKILRILANYNLVRRRMPCIKELKIKMGISESQILISLNKLEELGFIEWQLKPNTYYIKIIRAWEEDPNSPGYDRNSGNLEYWTHY